VLSTEYRMVGALLAAPWAAYRVVPSQLAGDGTTYEEDHMSRDQRADAGAVVRRRGDGWRRLVCGGVLATLLVAGCGGGSVNTGRAPAPPPAPPGAPASGSAASSGASANAGSAASAPGQQLKARSAYTTISAAAAPWWIALEAGYFREQGLDVELAHIDAGAPLLAAVTNGELDVVFSGAPTIVLGYIQGLDTVIIGSTSNVLDSVVFARPEYQRPEDLRGQTIGVTNLKAITDVAARLGFKRIGLEPDVDVFTRRTGGLAESLAAMETGAIAGASLNVPAVFEARQRGFREILNVTDMKIAFMSSAIAATKKTLAARPELGEPYLRALAQASSRLRTDREYAIDIIGKYSRSTDYDLLGATVDYYRPLYDVDPYPDPVALQPVIDAEENPGARTLKPEDVTDIRFGEAVRRSGFLDKLPK
jgi:NitT/TauT family transport system substrate-binding protein